ncbi:MAG: TIR domain-containing protein [Melioribacteraceae bacterium]|nr:TIR domain-containing protein [Melioribacteraceae bacterium]MCF8356900.1 TIR domain-containing protein [Melioribacteraceae bacterium]MCF8394307.1 TIR domain-containing protein [Melioribacteraceae bacterium]MCF8419986.1 TIR domain-containing protein [Melioribacteraceae bacterium]
MRIFLSYANEDYSLVEPYYNKLKNLGYKPWMDKKDIIPGMKWANFIWSAIKQSDVIIVFLSTNSSRKRGFVQREIREALRIWEEKLEDDIFLIPVRINECEVPEKLSSFQYTNLYESNGWDKLLESLEYTSKKLNIDIPNKANKYEIITKKFDEQKTQYFSYEIHCEYPELKGDQNFEEVNQIISGFIFENIQSFRKSALEIITDKELKDSYGETAMQEEMNIGYDIVYLSNKLISISFNLWFQSIGAAHGNGYQRTYNFEIKPTLFIQLEDLFDEASNYLDIISNYCIKELCKTLIGHAEQNDATIEWIKRGAAPVRENFTKFVITENTLKILFDVYQVGCFAEGHKFVAIPLTYFKNIAKEKGTINRLLKTV